MNLRTSGATLVAFWVASTARSLAADAVAEPSLVWRMQVTPQYEAQVLVNAFADSGFAGAFPLRELPIRLVEDRSQVSGGHVSLAFSMTIARLDVGPDGRVVDHQPTFVSANEMSINAWTGRMTMLDMNEPDKVKAATPVSESARTFPVDLIAARAGELYRWEESPDRSWGLVHTSKGTIVFTRGSPLPRHHISDRIYYGSFSRDGSRYAAVAEVGNHAHSENLRRWILISPEGEFVREGAPSRTSLSQLQLTPDGTVLRFEREGQGAISVDLETGEEKPLPATPNGTRYYSADGRTMLDLLSGSLQLLDLKDPLDPVTLAEFLGTSQSNFITGAVSSDGTLVAVQMVEEDDNRSHGLLRVVVYDRDLKQRTVVLQHTTIAGLQFEGRYLFVGIQRHPIPAYFDFQSTREIRVYDLRDL